MQKYIFLVNYSLFILNVIAKCQKYVTLRKIEAIIFKNNNTKIHIK